MALYQVFVPGLEIFLDPTKITGGQPAPAAAGQPPQVVGLLIQGVTAASAAAATAAVQAALPAANQQGLMHTWLQSNDTTE